MIFHDDHIIMIYPDGLGIAHMVYDKLSGFSLFEVLLAWLIFVVSITLLARMQIISLKHMQRAISQTQSAFIDKKC